MVEENKYWIYIDHSSIDFPSAYDGHAITIEGDTIINSETYKKVYWHELEGSNTCPYYCWTPNIP